MRPLKKPKEVREYRTTCYVNQDGITVFRCPKCGTTEVIDTNKKKYAFKNFRAKCKCGAAILGIYDFRRFPRKKVRLNGFFNNQKTGSGGHIIVENISLMGVDFCCLTKHSLQKGDQLDINFTLDNRKKFKVTLLVEVLHIIDRDIGVKICIPQKMQPELGFYLK